MSPSDSNAVRQALCSNWLTWSALNHLLPAPILRELFAVIVEQVGGRAVRLDHLFEELTTAGPTGLESWFVKMRDVSDPLPAYLQRRLQHILWRNDADAYPPDDEPEKPVTQNAASSLEAAVQLGRFDFGGDPKQPIAAAAGNEPSLSQLAVLIQRGRALRVTGELGQLPQEASDPLAQQAPAIAVAMAKHLGDLCGDADAWDIAKIFYQAAQQKLGTITDVGWQPFIAGMTDILQQSVAAAVRTVNGPGQAFAQLHQALEHASLRDRPVFAMNAAFDALTAQIATGSFHSYDRRATLLSPTYFHGSYDLDSVWGYFNDKKFENAERHCWSILRRQIALGLASETRATKAVFGRVVLASLEDINQHEPRSLQLAVRLLLESGDSAISKLDWGRSVINRYVNSAAVADLSEVTRRHDGSHPERLRVAIEILRSWLLQLAGDKQDYADDMMDFLTATARTGAVTFMSNQDVGGRSLEILKDVAKSRPEFLAPSARKLETAIVAKLQSDEFWRSKSTAIELSVACKDVFSREQIGTIAQHILRILDPQVTAANAWPIVRPALDFLTSGPAVILYKAQPGLGRRVLDTVLRLGAQETQSSQLVFYLRDFDPSLLSDPTIAAMLMPTVADLRKKALSVNSSGTAGEIQALLLSPTISGVDGVKDALTALKIAIKSCHDNRPRLALAYAYAPLQMITNRQKAFADELKLPQADIDAMWVEIYDVVVDFWNQLAAKPGLLAPFSFVPRSESNPVLVHNWAFASLRFAESLDRRPEMEEWIMRAGEKQESLRNAIQRALVIGATSDKDVAISPGEIEDEAPDVFYDGLGRRLLVMDSMATPDAMNLCKVLLQQCMRFGPRGLDAVVIFSASRLGLAGQLASALATNYLTGLSVVMKVGFSETRMPIRIFRSSSASQAPSLTCSIHKRFTASSSASR